MVMVVNEDEEQRRKNLQKKKMRKLWRASRSRDSVIPIGKKSKI